MKRLFLILSFLSLFFPKPALANTEINKFGIHILEPSDLPKAAELVNSSGGDWGWVTIVIRDDDMNHAKWQTFMDDCRVRHLVPLIRIATHLEGTNWAKPKLADASSWANFLADLNWPTSDQYVIIFNEPNHAKEWGGEINPREYARILSDFSSKFKMQSAKFKILNAGLDLAAPNSNNTMDSFKFMEEMNQEVPGIFDKIDGLSSHSYPNNGFLGKPWDDSKHSIKGYGYELAFLKNNLKTMKDLPVFITETGWPHEIANSKYQISKTGRKTKVPQKYYSSDVTANYLKYAFENVWTKDERIMAVTPFVLNYPEDLFANFSWFDKEGKPYPQYSTILTITKGSWQPKQETNFAIKSLTFPPFLLVNTEYKGKIKLKNTGQAIWGEYSDMVALSESSEGVLLSELSVPPNSYVKPGEEVILDYAVKSFSATGDFRVAWKGMPEHKIKVFPISFISKAQYGIWQKVISKIEGIFGR